MLAASQRSRAIGAIAQDRHLRFRRHAKTAQHAVQLRVLLVCLTGHATEQDQLPSPRTSCPDDHAPSAHAQR